jgi:hypothetical protein
MILLFLTLIPSLLWDAGPDTAATLEKAGVREIAVTSNAGDWTKTKVHAVPIDPTTLEKLDPPGVDYQLGRAGATATPWINSNLSRMLRRRDASYVYDVTGPAVPLAMAEAYAANARAYLRIKADDLQAYAGALRFLRDIDSDSMPPRVNFALLDDGSAEIDEVMNLLVRRNLLFQTVGSAEAWKGMLVRIGTPEYTKEMASNPYEFAAIVRSRVQDDRRLVRLYGTTTTLAMLYGGERRSRLHLIQYGRNPVAGMRVRVLGRFPRVIIAALGNRCVPAEDLTVDASSTEFTIPEFRNYAVVDLDSSEPGVLQSTYSAADFELTADPNAPQWRNTPGVAIRTNSLNGPLPFAPTEVRSRWTGDALYLMYTCPFRELSLKPDPVTDKETPVLWQWDVAEAFIGGDYGEISRYREYQVSPQGEWVDLDIDILHPQPQGGMGWNSGFQVKARIDRDRKIWYGEMKIPLSSIASKQFNRGDTLRLGLFRLTGPPPERVQVSWQPAFRRNFHVPEAFGTLVLN